MKKLLVLLLLLGVIAAGVFEWANAAWDEPGPATPDGKPRVILIPPGTRAHAVTNMLHDMGALNYPLAFEFDLRLRRLAEKLKAGEYEIPSKASMSDIAAILVAGRSVEHKLTAAEGLTSDMIYKVVAADPVLTGDAGAVPAEGTLLPETYLFTRGETRAHMLAKMARAQQDFVTGKWAARAPNLPIKTAREAVILASIVEKETALPEERPHIASVFVNRLRIGMRLQSDPTIIYGITRGYPLGRGIRQSELDAATPYNTYAIAGLPPTPIANPGKDAIAAVMNPLDSDDLYFVANGMGGHTFASSVADHARNVAAWRAQERLRAREIAPPDPASTVRNPAPLPQQAPRRGRRPSQ